jgi:hypothetical protein
VSDPSAYVTPERVRQLVQAIDALIATLQKEAQAIRSGLHGWGSRSTAGR